MPTMPMFRRQVLGHLVRRLREQAAAGVRANEILAELRQRCGDNERLPYQYLCQAFLQDNRFFYLLGPGVEQFGVLTEAEEARAAALMGARRAEWERQRFPALPRLRDYLAFLEVARDEHLLVTVCDVPPGSDHYRLHGVHDADSGEPVWSARRGEKLRAAFNRRLGGELVREGPHDDWEHRNDRAIAGPLWGPQLPAISFAPDGTIDNLLIIEDLASRWPHDSHWERLYPHHPVTS